MVQCDPGSANRMIDANCKCHLLIEGQELSTQYGTAVKVSFQVLAATDPAQKDKIHSEFFPCEGKAVDKFYNLAEAVGLVTAEQRKAATAAEQGLAVDETLLKGRQCCADIQMEANMRKNPATGQTEVDPEKPGPYPRIGFRTFAVTADKAKDIPKDAQFLGMLGQQTKQETAPQQQNEAGVPPGPGMSW